MKARMKKRQMYRRLTIVLVVAAILIVLVVGFYFAYVASNRFADLISKPVSAADLTSLRQLSGTPYGPSGASMLSQVKSNAGTSFISNGKPVLVYIGADYCMYCGIQRWPLVISLMRFGNFSDLRYMATGVSEGDHPTFTFHGSTYTSRYLVFQAYENRDRDNKPQDQIPDNYTTLFDKYGSAYPFMNFGNRYLITGAILDPTLLNGLDYQGVFNGINANSTLSTQVKEAANVFTSLICKITGNQPVSVCNAAPINGMTIQIAAYSPSQGLSIQQDSFIQVPTWVSGWAARRN